MTVTIRFFAFARELVGASELNLEIESGTSIDQLKNQLAQDYPKLAQLRSFLTAVNMEYVDDNTQLQDGDVVAIIPPVSGG